MTHHHSQQPHSSLMAVARTVGSTTLLLLLFVLFVWTESVHGTAGHPTTAPRTTTATEVSALGDPHFQTWSGTKYDFQGFQCDLVLLHGTKFATGRGIDIHIRNSKSSNVQHQQQEDDTDAEFSYISGVALRIGQDILQVASHGTYYLNGVPGQRATTNNDDEVLAGFPIVHRQLENDRYFYDVIVESGEDDDNASDPVIIRLTSYQDICGVRILFGDDNNKIRRDDYFSDAVGLLGRYESTLVSVGGEEMVARNGVTVLTDNPNAYGLEWQVRNSSVNDSSSGSSDPQLFQSNDPFPQYPQTCILPSPPTPPTTNTGVSEAVRADDARHVRRRRRRAATSNSSNNLQEAAAQRRQQLQAETACADKGLYVEECMFDVLKTGDITMAHAY